jgi:surfeit locus 1 family protein
VNEPAGKNELLLRIVPPFAAVLLMVVFALLGNWQLERAAEKVAIAATFERDSAFEPLAAIDEVEPFQRIEVRGRFLSQQQVLIDNIIRNSKVGYFVVTALEYDSAKPLLIVNRGWVEKPQDPQDLADITIDAEWRSLKGRAGHLPRVGIRSGEPFADPGDWPRVAVYPMLADVSTQLNRELLPFVLLLDAEADDGFMRKWEPRTAGPSTHYGYAFQWFALCLTVVGISFWQLRKKGFRL